MFMAAKVAAAREAGKGDVRARECRIANLAKQTLPYMSD
jgi:hypothetical protein